MSEHKSDWFPGRKSKEYLDRFDKIKWNKTNHTIKYGKAKQSTTSVLLQADEAIKAARTPIGKRDDKTFRYVD